VEAIWLASPSAVTGLLNQAELDPRTRVITIGPTTSAAARDAGIVVGAEARCPTFTGMLEATR
jgi:uroporphyrinogen-III synthase